MLECSECGDFIKEDVGVAMRHIISKHRKKMFEWYKKKGKIKIIPSKEDKAELMILIYKTTVK